ncbi:MAG: GntR family transcriptional regulator [Bauldia sp.]|nr:GntR family transcriptional regulator [Bauldia sp.]
MPPRLTRAQEIQTALADDIVHGRIGPGEALDETRLAAAFGVSRTPVREAIRQLEAIGLAEARPHRGAVAADISEQRLDEMFVVMAELEAMAARFAAAAMTPVERRELEQLHRSAGAIVSEGALAAYVAANDVFHDAVYRGAHNVFLAEMAQLVRARLAPFRHAQFETMGRVAKSHVEHGLVVEAILRGDGESAAAEMRRHILVVRTAVETVTQAIPGHERPSVSAPLQAGAPRRP